MNIQDLMSLESKSIVFISNNKQIVELFHNKALEDSNIFISQIKGENCLTKQELFQEFARELNFPSYFGNNWDAFDECICDLSWLKSNGYIVYINNADLLLSKENKRDLEIFISIINNAATFWKGKVLFKVILQSKKDLTENFSDN